MGRYIVETGPHASHDQSGTRVLSWDTTFEVRKFNFLVILSLSGNVGPKR
jgi:hypothetical protein